MDPVEIVILGVSLIALAGAMVVGVGVFFVGKVALEGNRKAREEYEADQVRRATVPPRVASWFRPPTVLLHDSCPADRVVVESAVAFWKALGYPIGEIRRTSDPSGVRGTILLIGKRASLGRTSVVTRISDHGRHWVDPVDLSQVQRGDHFCALDEIVSVYKDGQIDHAVITVPNPWSGVNMDLLVIHMFGHALGFAHAGAAPPGKTPTFRKGHVMTALLSQAGWNDEGLRK